ncbi:MAG: 2-amino-4-hydroxy-6-hydroxymethyldihydropteridine diphosphokinase [Verrucomicrobia bacterium]|nr:2-amino-4-hydroxy-6-hydroxymethyldihydropteridine diphosphokinase [Verrucomicrobiota bacterium]
MRRILLGLGSNHAADVKLPAMVERLADAFGSLLLSSIIRTQPEDTAAPAPDYHNAVVLISTAASLPEIEAITTAIEESLGRRKTAAEKQLGHIPADIDILCADVDAMPLAIREPYYRPLAIEVLHAAGLRASVPTNDEALPRVRLHLGAQSIGLAPVTIAQP